MTHAPARGYAADHANPAAVADAGSIPVPYGAERAEELDAVSADPEIRRLHDLPRLNVGAGDIPSVASVHGNDGLCMVTEIRDVFKCKRFGRARRQRQRLGKIGPNHVNEKDSRTRLRGLVDGLFIADSDRHGALAVFRVIAAIRPVGDLAEAGSVRL